MNPEGPTHPSTDPWVAAIHASDEDFTPIGTGLVIDLHRVLTCAHVVTSSQGDVRQHLWVAFPKGDEASRERIRIASVRLADNPRVADLAVLVLDDEVPDGIIPAPLRCPRPSDLISKRWWAFGFANGDPVGNSADGLVGASLGYGWIRLDAESRYHVESGFSGGGLWSPDYEAVVALVGEANARGDGRAITLYQADLALPGEELGTLASWSVDTADELALAAWGWTLTRDPEAVRHWRPRARGVSIDSERGYRFRGRSVALTAIVNWLDRPSPDRRVLVVTGTPGVGKSAVLGRIVTTADATVRAALPSDDDAVRASPGSIACAVHAKGKTALEIATEIARAASARLPDDAADLAPMLRDALVERRGKRFNVVIDALDEAATPIETRAIIRQIVLPLVETCSDVGAQVVVGSRRRDDSDLLRLFGDAIMVIDLDSRKYFAEADLAEYAMACLQLIGDERPENPYSDNAIARSLAHRIAKLADRNFLIAGLVARDHGLHDQHATDPEWLRFTATVDAALASYLERVGSIADIPAATILTALAFAQAPGLPINLWCLAIETLEDKRVTPEQLSRFARSSAANFLVESSGKGSTAVFRLFHQALDDALLKERAQLVARVTDELALTQAFILRGKQSGWVQAPDYLLRSLATHAARANVIDYLLTEDNYLLYADLRRLIPLADNARSKDGQNRARMLHLTPRAITANPENRAALFSVTEAVENLGHSYSKTSLPKPYCAKWASVSVKPRLERAILEGHTGSVRAVCAFTLDGQVLLASASQDRTIRLWDPATGEERTSLEGHDDWVRAVCAFTLDGQVLLASASDDRTLRLWDPADGKQKAAFANYPGWVMGVCAFTLDDRVLLATVGKRSGVRIWDAATGQRRAILEDSDNWGPADRGICAFTVGRKVLLASAGEDSVLRIWDPAKKQKVFSAESHDVIVNGVCSFVLEGQTLLASAYENGHVSIWNPVTGAEKVIRTESGAGVSGVCALTCEGRVLLAGACEDQTITIWDPEDWRISDVLEGHVGWVNSICTFTLGNRDMLASASDDATVRIWDLANCRAQARSDEHASQVNGLCTFSSRDRVLLASTTDDNVIQIWDAVTGKPNRILEGHDDLVNAVCPFTLNGHVMLASASDDTTVRIWNPKTGKQRAVLRGDDDYFELSPIMGVCAFALDNRMLLGSTTYNGEVLIWNPSTRKKIATLEGHDGLANDVCTFTLDGRVLLASVSDDTTVRIWDPSTHRRIATLQGHAHEVHGICAFSLNDRVLLASASSDRTVRIWDPSTRKRVATLQGHADEVHGICAFSLNDRVLLASASSDRTVRIWDPATEVCSLAIPTHHAARAIAYGSNSLAIGLSVGILTIEIGQIFSKLQGA